MRIDLNDPVQFTKENVAKLIASKDDSTHTQFRVSKDGYLYLSEAVGNKDLENVLFRLETNSAGSDLVGIDASKNDAWVTRIYEAMKKHYPKPMGSYIDVF